MQATINRIRASMEEREYLLQCLELWAQVKEQGIDPDSVRCFGFDMDLLSWKQKVALKRHRDPMVLVTVEGSRRPHLFNYVRHHDGTMTALDPMLRAVYRP